MCLRDSIDDRLVALLEDTHTHTRGAADRKEHSRRHATGPTCS